LIISDINKILRVDQEKYLELCTTVVIKIDRFIQASEEISKTSITAIRKENTNLLNKLKQEINLFINNAEEYKIKILEKEMDALLNLLKKAKINIEEIEYRFKKEIDDLKEKEQREDSLEKLSTVENEISNKHKSKLVILSKFTLELNQKQLEQKLITLQKRVIEQINSSGIFSQFIEFRNYFEKISGQYYLIFNSTYKNIENEISEEERKRIIEKHQEIEEKIELLVILPLKLIKNKGRGLLEEGEKVNKKLLEKQTGESLYSFTEYEKEWKEWKKRTEIILAEEIEIKELKIEKDLIQKEKEELKEIITQNEIKYKEVKRIKEFVEVLSNYSEITLIELQQRLDFAELQDLEMWLLDLSSVLSIRIEGDKLIIPEKATREITQSIDELIKRFSEWEKTGEGKKI